MVLRNICPILAPSSWIILHLLCAREWHTLMEYTRHFLYAYTMMVAVNRNKVEFVSFFRKISSWKIAGHSIGAILGGDMGAIFWALLQYPSGCCFGTIEGTLLSSRRFSSAFWRYANCVKRNQKHFWNMSRNVVWAVIRADMLSIFFIISLFCWPYLSKMIILKQIYHYPIPNNAHWRT